MFRFKRVAGIFLSTAIFAVRLFTPVGTAYWPRAWLLLGVVPVAVALSTFAILEDLLDERFKGSVQAGRIVIGPKVAIGIIEMFLEHGAHARPHSFDMSTAWSSWNETARLSCGDLMLA